MNLDRPGALQDAVAGAARRRRRGFVASGVGAVAIAMLAVAVLLAGHQARADQRAADAAEAERVQEEREAAEAEERRLQEERDAAAAEERRRTAELRRVEKELEEAREERWRVESMVYDELDLMNEIWARFSEVYGGQFELWEQSLFEDFAPSMEVVVDRLATETTSDPDAQLALDAARTYADALNQAIWRSLIIDLDADFDQYLVELNAGWDTVRQLEAAAWEQLEALSMME